MCSSNCSNLQTRMDLLKISKPAGHWWRTHFWGTARNVLFIYSSSKSSLKYPFNYMVESTITTDPICGQTKAHYFKRIALRPAVA